MHLIHGKDCYDAWHIASLYISSQKKSFFNLIVNIENPCIFDFQWLEKHNPKDIVLPSSKRGDDIRDVIHTLSPGELVYGYK